MLLSSPDCKTSIDLLTQNKIAFDFLERCGSAGCQTPLLQPQSRVPLPFSGFTPVSQHIST